MKFRSLPAVVFCLAIFGKTPAVAQSVEAKTQPSSRATTSTLADSVRRLLHDGSFNADAMQFESAPRMAELGNKFIAATKKHPDWFQNAVKQAKPGEPLAYHPNMGLTKQEYQEFLRLTDGGIVLKKLADATIKVKYDGNAALITIDPPSPKWASLKLNMITLALSTPYGVMKSPEAITNGKAFDGRTFARALHGN